jgi:hypothetical protein
MIPSVFIGKGWLYENRLLCSSSIGADAFLFALAGALWYNIKVKNIFAPRGAGAPIIDYGGSI